MSQNFKFLIPASIIFLFLSGCVSPPRSSGFLSDYSGMSAQNDLDQVRISQDAHVNQYETLVIAPVSVKELFSSLGESDRRSIVKKLEENFRIEMSHYFPSVITGDAVTGNKPLRLELALTELEPTDVAMNLLVGFGAGNATGSIEGRFVDAETGAELIAFSDRKKGSPFTKKEFNAQTKFPNWSKLRYLYLFTETWAENVGNIVERLKNSKWS